MGVQPLTRLPRQIPSFQQHQPTDRRPSFLGRSIRGVVAFDMTVNQGALLSATEDPDSILFTSGVPAKVPATAYTESQGRVRPGQACPVVRPVALGVRKTEGGAGAALVEMTRSRADTFRTLPLWRGDKLSAAISELVPVAAADNCPPLPWPLVIGETIIIVGPGPRQTAPLPPVCWRRG